MRSLLLCLLAEQAAARTWYVSAAAKDAGDGSQGKPFQKISPAAASAQPGDTVLVGAGVYRERVAPANSGEEGKPITYKAAPGERVVITASEVLEWKKSSDFGGSFVAELPDSLFDTLDGTPNTRLYNPFSDWLQPSQGCKQLVTGQVYVDGEPLASIFAVDLHKCNSNPYKPDGCFSPNPDGKPGTLYARWPKRYNGSMPESVEVTVRSRVFAPHKRGLRYIVVEGFVIEHAANQWDANFWFPENYHYAQSGAIGTRTGYKWTIRNNTIRKAGTIALDIGSEGGYQGHPVDNEETNQSTPAMYGAHTIEHNIFEKNGCQAVAGYGMVESSSFSYNIVQDNGGCGCAGAENAAFKNHGFRGIFEGNVFRRNTGGAAIWFDGNGGPMRFTRNTILVGDSNTALVFELGDGGPPGFTHTLADNNIIVGNGGGGIGAQDACGIELAHNLIFDWHSGSAVTLGGLTGRNSGMYDWWVEANMLFSVFKEPWLRMHHRKVIGGHEAIRNETVQHNFVYGAEPVYPTDAGLNITVGSNQPTPGDYWTKVAVDSDLMVLNITGDALMEKAACKVGGPGGDKDFTGAKRSDSKCMPGPLNDLAAGQQKLVSLWPAGITPPPSPTPPPTPTPPTPPPTPPTPPTPPPTPASCHSEPWQTDVVIGNGQISLAKVADAAACCSLCEKNAQCACWTFKTADDPYDPKDCMLKSHDQCTEFSKRGHRVSAVMSKSIGISV